MRRPSLRIVLSVALVAVSLHATPFREVNVRDFGATGDGGTDDTVAIQNAINTGGSVYFPPGTYRVSQLHFHWGDSGKDPMRQYRGNQAKIVGLRAKQKYLFDVSGQNSTFAGLEFQGLGPSDDTYDTLMYMHTRDGKCPIDKIFLDKCVFRMNQKLLTIGHPAEKGCHVAKISEFFFDNCWFSQCQKVIDDYGCDAIFDSCHFNPTLPKKRKVEPDDNYIIKIRGGTARFTSCNFMQTALGHECCCGWAVIFADNGNSSTVSLDSCTLEWKRGARWMDGSGGELHINGNVNGYCGFPTVKDPFFSVGKGSRGLLDLNSFFYRRDIGRHGASPLIVDARQSPEFRIIVDETSVFGTKGGKPESLLARILGGQYNFPNAPVAVLYGNKSVKAIPGRPAMIEFARDGNSEDYPDHRFAGLYRDGWLTVPPEGLEGAFLEVLVDWSGVEGAKAEVVRQTALSCRLTAGSRDVVVDAGSLAKEYGENQEGSTFFCGLVPGAGVLGDGLPVGAVISPDGFGKNAFRLASPAAASGGQVLTFEMEIAPVRRGRLQRIALGNLLPGDRVGIRLEAGETATATTGDASRLVLTGRSAMISAH